MPLLDFWEIVWKDCEHQNNGKAHEKGNDNDINIIGAKILSIILWYHDPFINSFNGGVGNVWSNPHTLNVPHWTLFENIKGVHSQ